MTVTGTSPQTCAPQGVVATRVKQQGIPNIFHASDNLHTRPTGYTGILRSRVRVAITQYDDFLQKSIPCSLQLGLRAPTQLTQRIDFLRNVVPVT